MKKIIYQLLILVIGTGFFSCDKKLDLPPLHDLDPGSAISDITTAKAAVGGIYRTFLNNGWGGNNGNYVTKAGFMNFRSVDYNMTYTQTSPSAAALSCWQTYYGTVNAANFAITGINALSDAQIKSNERLSVLAEARGLRAWANINLLWAFGHWWKEDSDPYGILYRDVTVDLSNVEQERISVGESYAKIYEDLDFAIENMPDFTSSRYISKQFVKVLKAKILLYRGGYRNTMADLQSALTLVDDVLNNHPAIWDMEADMSKVYADSWDSKECLFNRYIESTENRGITAFFEAVTVTSNGNRIPLSTGVPPTAGLKYGLDWFNADGRWPIVTGITSSSNATQFYNFKKLSRYGQFAGRTSTDPKAEFYTVYNFRFPELYLLKAELLARTGASVAASIAPINLMRSRRTNPVLPALNPADQDELMLMIFKEIFLETVLENGSEFFASTRFQFAGQPFMVTLKGGIVPFVENKLCWPIPDAEMLNNGKMVQNPE